MKKRTQAIWLSLILIAALPGLTPAKDRLANGYSSASGVFAGLWIAQEGKIFEKYDIDSHLVLIASGSMMVQSMLGGDLPIAGAAGSAAVDASLGGADIVMFGSMVKVPAFYIMALPEIKTIDDLRGKVGRGNPLRFLDRLHDALCFTQTRARTWQRCDSNSDGRFVCRGDHVAHARNRRCAVLQPGESQSGRSGGARPDQHGQGRSVFST